MKLELFVETLEGSQRRKMFPVHFSCVSSVDTPADSIKATFLISHPKKWMKEIKTLELQGDGNRLFHGICDRQIVSLQQDGCRMTVWGRSDAALLLDNEAIPQEYVRVSLDEMFDKHIKPYGFQNELGLTGSLSNYRVGKGISEWGAFSTFCRRAVGRTPHIHFGKVSFFLPGKGNHIISEKTPVISVRWINRRSEIISETLIRDEMGSYRNCVQNEKAEGLGIVRRRCLIPSAQWANPAVDAKLQMEESARGKVCLEVEMPQILSWELGEEVIVSIPEFYFWGNIAKRELEFSQSGAVSRFVLE